MRYFWQQYEQARATASNRIVDLPKNMYTVLPDHKPTPGRLQVTVTLLAIVGVSVLFAMGVMV